MNFAPQAMSCKDAICNDNTYLQINHNTMRRAQIPQNDD